MEIEKASRTIKNTDSEDIRRNKLPNYREHIFKVLGDNSNFYLIYLNILSN